MLENNSMHPEELDHASSDALPRSARLRGRVPLGIRGTSYTVQSEKNMSHMVACMEAAAKRWRAPFLIQVWVWNL